MCLLKQRKNYVSLPFLAQLLNDATICNVIRLPFFSLLFVLSCPTLTLTEGKDMVTKEITINNRKYIYCMYFILSQRPLYRSNCTVNASMMHWLDAISQYRTAGAHIQTAVEQPVLLVHLLPPSQSLWLTASYHCWGDDFMKPNSSTERHDDLF